MTIVVPVLASVLIGIGIFLVVAGRVRATNIFDPLASALQAYGQQDLANMSRVDQIEMQRSFRDRVVSPTMGRVRTSIESATPDAQKYQVEVKLLQAGRPYGFHAGDLAILRYALTVFMFIVGLMLGTLLHSPVWIAVFAAVGALMGYYGPVLWLNGEVGKRHKAISKSLPDALDLMVVSVEAGLSLEAAMDRVATKMVGPLADEFALAMTEMRLGLGRIEALSKMGERSGADELHQFCQVIVSSDTMGTPVGRILRLQSEEMRRKRRQRAQELGAQATLKMTMPMVGCVFPTIWIILLGPAVMLIMNRH